MPVDQERMEKLARLMALELVVAELASQIQVLGVMLGADPAAIDTAYDRRTEILAKISVPGIEPVLSDHFTGELSTRIMAIWEMAKDITDRKLGQRDDV
jgi:hypothetical protein